MKCLPLFTFGGLCLQKHATPQHEAKEMRPPPPLITKARATVYKRLIFRQHNTTQKGRRAKGNKGNCR